MIRFECPHCGKGLRTDDDTIGEAFNCPSCRGRVRVPESGVEFVAERRAGSAGRFQVRPCDDLKASVSPLRAIVGALAGGVLLGGAAAAIVGTLDWTVAISAAIGAILGCVTAWLLRPHFVCRRCRRGMTRRELGTIERDAQSAGEALATGDLPALRALSPEGATVRVAIRVCSRCGPAAPFGVRFITMEAGAERELAHMIYPGAALSAFERLCKG